MSSTHKQWTATLFGCTEDWNTCCRVFWLPCWEHAEQGQFIIEKNRKIYWEDMGVYFILWFLCLEWTVGTLRRQDIRRKYNIAAKPYEDLVTHLCCHPCAACQESRQIKYMMYNSNVEGLLPLPEGGSTRRSGHHPAVIFERHRDYVISGGVKQEVTSPFELIV